LWHRNSSDIPRCGTPADFVYLMFAIAFLHFLDRI
jgi:hypothetical protein